MITALRNYLANNPFFFTLLRKIIELNFRKEKAIIRHEFNLASPKKVLDIGCGTGEFSTLYKNHDYTGIDISSRYIEFAKKHHKGKFAVMDATTLQFPDQSFDYVLIMAILHHLSDQDVAKVLSEAKRVLKPGGKVLIMEDAKIDELRNWFVKLTQRFDLGDYIRVPSRYRELIQPYFTLGTERTFRSGGCTYYSIALTSS